MSKVGPVTNLPERNAVTTVMPAAWMVHVLRRAQVAKPTVCKLALFSAPAPRPQATPCPPSTRQSRLALFSIVGKARVEGVSPSDRGQDARDTIGFVSHNPSPAACSLMPVPTDWLCLARRAALVVTPQGVSWRGRLGLVFFRQLALFLHMVDGSLFRISCLLRMPDPIVT
jgi:hypothetical protein